MTNSRKAAGHQNCCLLLRGLQIISHYNNSLAGSYIFQYILIIRLISYLLTKRNKNMLTPKAIHEYLERFLFTMTPN